VDTTRGQQPTTKLATHYSPHHHRNQPPAIQHQHHAPTTVETVPATEPNFLPTKLPTPPTNYHPGLQHTQRPPPLSSDVTPTKKEHSTKSTTTTTTQNPPPENPIHPVVKSRPTRTTTNQTPNGTCPNPHLQHNPIQPRIPRQSSPKSFPQPLTLPFTNPCVVLLHQTTPLCIS
jgi:hypothetical protein